MGSLVHVAAYAIRGSNGVLVHSIDRSVERRGIHLIMGTCQSGVAFLASLGFSRLLRIEGMRGMAAITLVLHIMAPFTKGLSQRAGESTVLGMFLHCVPGDKMPPLLELGIFFFMAFTTHLRFNSRFFRPGLIMAFVTGNAIYSLLGMFAVDPGLKNSPCLFLMTGQAIANLFFC
jgi:hypothetical protein